jgi:hypothetical protein
MSGEKGARCAQSTPAPTGEIRSEPECHTAEIIVALTASHGPAGKVRPPSLEVSPHDPLHHAQLQTPVPVAPPVVARPN